MSIDAGWQPPAPLAGSAPAPAAGGPAPVVELDNVSKTFIVRRRPVRALVGVDLLVRPGETVGLIGESGSGKTTLGRVALGLTTPDSGTARFLGSQWDTGRRAGRALRSELSVVYQDPGSALNPRLNVGSIVLEPIRLHRPSLTAREQEEAARRALGHAHLHHASLWSRYPRQLSGGQQQRVGIARAIATSPRFIVLDEPTASLDAAVRAGILSTLAELKAELSLSFLLISHDIATIRKLSDRVVVLYRGVVVETGPAELVLSDPQHPYTKALIDAVLPLRRNPARAERPPERLARVPLIDDASRGCVLYGRCPYSDEGCVGAPVELQPIAGARSVACVKVHAG